jgi:hypothetical protein
MRTNDDVGALAHLGGLLELLAHVGRDLDDDLDAVLLAERVYVLLDDRSPVVVRPDHQVGDGVTNGRGRR